MAYMRKYAASPRQTLVIYAKYDLTFLEEFSLDVIRSFDEHHIDYEARRLPSGHYTSGETPYKYMIGWYLGRFIYRAFKKLQSEPQRAQSTSATVEKGAA